MIVKTKKYQLEKKIYTRLALKNALKSMWWVFLIPIVMTAMTFVPAVSGNWWWITALILTTLYILFWWVQFKGITQLPQYATLFDKLAYEIDSRQILMKINTKQGMPIQWTQIKKASKDKKNNFTFLISKAQLIYLPEKCFNSSNDVRFLESLIKKKGYIK